MELKQQSKEVQRYKNVENKPRNGYITTNDLIDLQRLKLELFPDYKELTEHLDNMRKIQQGLRPRHSPRNLNKSGLKS